MSLIKLIIFLTKSPYTIYRNIVLVILGHCGAIAAASGVSKKVATRWSLEYECGSCWLKTIV